MIAMDGGSSNGNDGSAMGGGIAEKSQWAMRRRRHETIAADAELVQSEFVFNLCFFLLSSQLGKLPPAPVFCYSFCFS
jgi:hypothetical protein